MRTLIVTTMMVLSITGFSQLGAKLLQKAVDKKFGNVDESLVQEMEFYINEDFSQRVNSVPDGTRKLTVRCPINKEAAGLKKMGMQKEFTWFFNMVIVEHTTNEEKVEINLFSDEDKIENWSEIINGDGYLQFELEDHDLLRHLSQQDGSFEKQSIKLKCSLFSYYSKGQTYLNRSNLSINCDGPNGKWETNGLNEFIENFKSGDMYEGNINSQEFKRMLAYSKNEWPNADIIHLKVVSTSVVDNGDRLQSDIWVVICENGKCSNYNVAVWEDRESKALHNFTPQFAQELSKAFYYRKEEIRNLK